MENFTFHRYLEIKFQEMEEKLRHEKEKGRKSSGSEDSSDETNDNQNEIDDELPGGTTEEGADENAASSSDEKSFLAVVNEIASTERAVIAPPTSSVDSLKLPTTTLSIHDAEAERTQASRSSSEEDQQNFIVVTSERPRLHHYNVEQERLEVIEIKHDGASGHLSHDI